MKSLARNPSAGEVTFPRVHSGARGVRLSAAEVALARRRFTSSAAEVGCCCGLFYEDLGSIPATLFLLSSIRLFENTFCPLLSIPSTTPLLIRRNIDTNKMNL